MTATSTVYESLPGLSVPLGDALEELAAMWSPADETGKRRDNEYRASRMNLVVHIGFEAGVEEAKELFQTVISFSHRYPCRMVVLCPQPESWDSKERMGCKIFSECVFGEGAGGMSCCEVLILGYTLSERRYLENQVSIFLETDLPTYYWPTRFESAQLLSDYKSFFREADRIIFDSSRECFLVDQVEIPQPEKVHDLAFSRILQIRQSIGQFLSAFTKAQIVGGLQKVSLETSADLKCEGRALMGWVGSALSACFDGDDKEKDKIRFEQKEADSGSKGLTLKFEYEDDRFVTYVVDFGKGEAHVDADLGNGRQELTTGARILDLESALAEALFFA